jgi:hypothetical protein
MSGWIPKKLTALSSGAATDGQVLTADGAGAAAWEDATGGGGSGSGGTVGARVRRSTDQTITTSTRTAISFDVETADTGGMWVVGSPTRLTAPADDWYAISGGVRWAISATAGIRQAEIRLDGSTLIAIDAIHEGHATNAIYNDVATHYYMAAGQYVELTVFQNTGGNLAVANAASFTPIFSMVRLPSGLGSGTELTIASGAVTITQGFHTIDTESDAASDDLDTISGGTTGQLLVVKAADDARSVVAKGGTGNLRLAGDFTLDDTDDSLSLLYDGSNWIEIARSDNA